MPRGKNLTLTEAAAFGLFFIQRYRFLTIDQFARITGINRSTASGQLLFLERQGYLHHFGNTKLSGHGKTPKAYFLTRKGFELSINAYSIKSYGILSSFADSVGVCATART
jgi:predicted ArsR family transcriptional regulator